MLPECPLTLLPDVRAGAWQPLVDPYMSAGQVSPERDLERPGPGLPGPVQAGRGRRGTGLPGLVASESGEVRKPKSFSQTKLVLNQSTVVVSQAKAA